MVTLCLHLGWPSSQTIRVSIPQSTQAPVVLQGMFDAGHRVPDVDRYVVRTTPSGAHQLTCHGTSDFPASCYMDKTPQGGHSNIVILLESPHKDEYEPVTFSPVAPAQGTTGKNIADHLCGYFDTQLSGVTGSNYMHLHANGSHIVLCNPVQFQASLRARKHRLKPKSKVMVWERLWNVPGVKADFLQRLIRYRPHIIINACTKTGRSDDGCKNLVRTFLDSQGARLPTRCHVYEAPHPSSWHFARRSNFCYSTQLGP